MKKLYVIIFTILTLGSCKTNSIKSKKENYILAYKTAVLYGCINEATNEEFQNFSKENNDLGLAIEAGVLFHSNVLKAIELGAKLSKKIRSINYQDYNGRKPIYSDCVSFAFSKEVDSIARLNYKKEKKGDLKYLYR